MFNNINYNISYTHLRHAVSLYIDLDKEIEDLEKELEQHPKGAGSQEQEGYTLKGLSLIHI